ncbi:MAG: hypothetical protein ABI207_09255 [Crocinitomicaceae bacterium]
MEISSVEVNVHTSITKLFTFLTDTRNFVLLLPKDKISEWKADETSCSFKVQNAATISLLQKELNPYSTILMISGEKSPFPFSLTLNLKENGEEFTLAQLEFDGEVNAFLKMMVQKPLTNLFNHMAEKLKAHFDESQI